MFVTGGSGFVGGAIVRHLIDAGRPVRALARSRGSAERLERAGARPVPGDVFDAEALLGGMRGCGTVFHAAGVNASCLQDPSPMLHTNIEGSAAVMRAAATAGVRRFIYTSSAATLGEPRGTVGREDARHRGGFLSAYERSKYLAERRVMELAPSLGLAVVTVNPSSVQGPGRAAGSARILVEILRRRRAVIVDGWLSIVDVDDCATGHLLAEEHGTAGERYVLNGASLTTRDAVTLLQGLCGAPERVVRLPRAVVSIAGAVVGGLGRLTRRPPAICPEVARTLLHGHRYDGSRATLELGVSYRPLADTVERTLRWLADQGLIPPLPAPNGST